MKNYSDFYKTIETNENSYFIGANTPRGFAYADDALLDETRYTKLYIIKGGPGTGKSSMMKKCREHFEALGAETESYYCSSDPDSLDAVIIKKNGKAFAIADGTAPHALDAALPGTVSEVVNLGEYWNSPMLEEKRSFIAETSAKKTLAFELSKRYLSSAAEIAELLRKTAAKGFKAQKAQKYIRRLISSLPRQRSAAEKRTVITTAISMKGAFRLPTFDRAETVIAISDLAHIAPLFLDLLSQELEKAGHSQYISYSPLGEMTEIYLPVADISFVPLQNETVYDRTIRLPRFADKEYFSSCTAKRRFNERCLLEMLNGALVSLSEAKEYHFALEDIYVNAMNFDGINGVCSNLNKKIEHYL